METCVRGFSFMPEIKVESGELKYVGKEDLEKTWKITRRERLKKQEQKIWEEFIMEQDIVRNVSQDDPYQFLDQVSEECIKELLDLELQKMKQEAVEEQIEETKEQSLNNTTDNQHIVTFINNEEQECTMFQVFDDDKDDEISGPEEEALNDSINSPPCTVRERQEEIQESTSNNLSRQPSPEKICCKSSSENVTNLIENSIYCAKLKELRMKINDELINITNILENQNLSNIDPCDVPKMMKRSSEFSCRYNRVHLYQLQRQMVDIDRNSNMVLPFAQRTHHQAQLVRITSLHNNILHAVQVLLKSFQQTSCIGDASELVKGLIRTLRESKDCMGLVESSNMFDDTIEETCVKLEETLNEYTTKMSDFLNNIDSTSASSKKSNKTKGKDKSGSWTKPDSKSFKNAETRLSMYSLETMRVSLNPKPSKCKDSSSSSSKISNMKSKDTENVESGISKKTPRKRRPLMRGSTSTRERMPCEQDVHTLVEVIACTSSHNDINKSPPKTKLTPRTPKSNRKSTKTRNNANKTSNNNKITKEDSRTNESTRMDSSRSSKEKDKETKKDIGDENLCANEKDSNIKELDSEDMRRSESKKENRSKAPEAAPDSCEVTKVLRQLCGGDTRSRNEHISGSRNAQLLCVHETSPRKPSTPQLLRILEETIQKKAPKPLFPTPKKVQDAEKYLMTLNTPENVKDDLLKYRTKFVQHMLTSSMYANSAVGKPWEKIGSVSEKIIDELLLNCAKEMELDHFVTHLYKSETS